MAQVIQGGINGFDALLYPTYNPVNLQYFQNSIAAATQNLNEVGRNFMASAQELYERVNGSQAIQAARNVLRMVGGAFHDGNHVYAINTIENFQSASPVMQRWIMANPDVRALYQQQRCSGYAETYHDLEVGRIKESHYDYRRVMDTVVQEEGKSWVAIQYFDELKEGDRNLTTDEKVDIMNTWDIINCFIAKGKEDPTDPMGGYL
jgi:hypothetical protein